MLINDIIVYNGLGNNYKKVSFILERIDSRLKMERLRYPKRAKELVAELSQAKEEGRLGDRFSEIFGMHEMDMMQIWESRFFIKELPDAFYKENIHLLPFRVLIESMAGNVEECERVARFNTRDFAEIRKTTLTPNDYSTIMTELIMPRLDNAGFIERINYLVDNLPFSIPGLALTACRPGVINGFRDLTVWCPRMHELRSVVEKDINMLYGKSAKGIYDVALAEWKYETDKVFEALLLVADTIPTLDYVDDIRCLVAAYALQLRILILNGQTKCSDGIFEKIIEKAKVKHYEEMESSVRALKCLFACYEGDSDKIEEWLEYYAPNEDKDIFTMDIYAYFVKMRCYLQTGRYMMTSLLSRRLIELFKKSYRPHDTCECYILSAMACYKAGDKKTALNDFKKALEIGISAGYMRLFSDEGQMMLNLIELYREDKKKHPEQESSLDEKKLREIKTAALEIARRFPTYLEAMQDMYNALTKTEKAVLVLLAEGLSNDEIAIKLNKKCGSIKFHTSGIYKKLKVENRQQAVNRARDLGIV